MGEYRERLREVMDNNEMVPMEDVHNVLNDIEYTLNEIFNQFKEPACKMDLGCIHDDLKQLLGWLY